MLEKMSHFSSIKIKLNDNDHLGTLLAEYGGNFEIKVWILDKSEAWTGELSSTEAQEFILRYNLKKETFLKDLQTALMSSDPKVLYSLDKNETNTYLLSWKECDESGITIKNGEMTLEKVAAKDIYDEVLERSFEQNSQLQSRMSALEKEKEGLLKERETLFSSLEKVVNVKDDFEKSVYSQFLSVLNAKKEKIAELQEYLDSGAPSKGTSSKANTREVRTESPKIASKVEEQVDPFEVDTDVEEESPSPRAVKREASEAGSQSFNLDSFDEVCSPLAVLPKRSRVEVKPN